LVAETTPASGWRTRVAAGILVDVTSSDDDSSTVHATAASPAESAPDTSVRVQRTVRGVTVEQLWELMWRPRVQELWLGGESSVTVKAGTRLRLSDGGSIWRTGRTGRTKNGRLTAELDQPIGRTGDPTRLVVQVTSTGDESNSLEILEDGLTDRASRAESSYYWEAAADRLLSLVSAAKKQLSQPRQAVIIIHGIGEQRPGRTLRDFVKAGVIGPDKATRWVKPDRDSGLFDLRRVTYQAGPVTPRTDVFELYWAHIIRDTTLAQVSAWIRRLMMRRRVPKPIRPLWLAVWAITVIVAVALVAQLFVRSAWFSAGSVLVVALALGWRFVGRGAAIDILGDAARYLTPDAGNIAHRQAIRTAGVDLLARLHKRGIYDRIVVLGHSLGSVIAYDIITNAWIQMNASHGQPHVARFAATIELEKAIGTVTDPDEAQRLQYNAWCEQRRNTQPWLVTDLVTVGSPLTYAQFLMADSADDFGTAKADRVLPTCPPVTELEKKSGHLRCTYDRPYTDSLGGAEPTFTVFHHGAPFALTRWTNLYFPTRWGGISGDLVGGPLALQFGAWVKDVPLASPVRGFAHTCYWRRVGSSSAHVDALRDAIRPTCKQELLALGETIPAWLIVERNGSTTREGR